jgi:glycosyltransferase involved in cell wall biosynthesis
MSSGTEERHTIAVIIPVRDGAAFLAEAINSVINQIGDHATEIVVVDDGSRDHSAAIAAGYACVRCIRQPALGLPAALNHGLHETRAPLVAFLDSDDVMPSDSLAARHAMSALNCEYDVVVGRMVQFMDPSATSVMSRRLRADPCPARAYVAGTCLIRRTVFDRIGKFDAAIGTSTFIDWVLRARHAAVRFHEIDAVVLQRRVHGANCSLDRRTMQANYLRALRRHFARQRKVP